MNIQAIPTEYRGTRFRSKSEAIFAKAMDLAGFDKWEYEWEPNGGWVQGDRYVPDFSLLLKPELLVLIEYKPSRATDTYIKARNDWLQKIKPNCPLLIFMGGAYERQVHMAVCLKEGDKAEQWKGLVCMDLLARPIANKLSAAKRHRFDLLKATA